MHDLPRDVLVIGGGEGATLREVLAHQSVRRAVMIDIDPEVVELCRQILPSWHCGAFSDPRAVLRFEDGRGYLESSNDLFDIIVVDIVDMLDNGPAQRIYTRQFYELARTHLRPGGIVVVQGLEFSFADYKAHGALARTLATAFTQVHSYQVTVPSFLAQWGFLIASDWLVPEDFSADMFDRRIQTRLGPNWLDHATGPFIKASFCLCRDTQFHLGLPGPILDDESAFIPPPDIAEEEAGGVQLPALREG